MALSQTPASFLSLLLVALSQTPYANASPYPKDDLRALGYEYLMGRQQCAIPCGYQNAYCCAAGSACYTNAQNIATCTAVQADPGNSAYTIYQTVFTETDTVLTTSYYTSWYPASTPAPAPVTTQAVVAPICTSELGESSCGTICCASNQRCAFANSCTAYTVPATSAAGSAPLRPTSGGVSTATAVVSATTTVSFIPPATASGSTLPITSSSSNNGLSPGAIAGIVIGVIAGIILLLVCFCCIIKAGFDGLLALFGLGKRKRRSSERVEVIEERYSRHGSGTARPTHSTWFGAGRPATVVESRKRKSSGFGGLGYVGAGLLGLAAVLGLKRRHDRKEKPARSEVSGSSYSSYTDTSASE